MNPYLFGLIGTIIGAIIGACTVWITQHINRQQQAYIEWLKSMSDHNWKLLQFDLDSGLDITKTGLKTRIVCYQHLTLLHMIWSNKSLRKRPEIIKGLKNWTKAIMNGSKNRKEFSDAYYDILKHKDLYPPQFIDWLNSQFGLSEREFTSN